MTATVSMVATPIGNMGDITYRAVQTLTECDYICAEDTRVIRKVLDHYNIKRQSGTVMTLNEHTTDKDFNKYLELLDQGCHIAVVTDAGTPGISDPGGRFVSYVRAHRPDTAITPIPGASALTALVSVSGGYCPDGVVFLGFPPHKKGRQTFIRDCLSYQGKLVVVYESSHRIEKFLSELDTLRGDAKIRLTVGREITKMHEEIIDTEISEYREYLKNNPVKTKGEFVVGIYYSK